MDDGGVAVHTISFFDSRICRDRQILTWCQFHRLLDHLRDFTPRLSRPDIRLVLIEAQCRDYDVMIGMVSTPPGFMRIERRKRGGEYGRVVVLRIISKTIHV